MVRTLSEEEILEVISQCDHAHLGCHARSKTYVVPISFVSDGRRLHGFTRHGMKTEFMEENPHVCIQFEQIESLSKWKSVIAWGKFRILDGVEPVVPMQRLVEKYGTDPETETEVRQGRNFIPDSLGQASSDYIVYEVTFDEVTGRCEE